MNRIVLIGRLTRDPELRYTPNGVAIATFTLAVDRPRANQQGQRETDFIDIQTWRGLAELCANYLKKGSLTAVDGRLEIHTYDASDRQKRKATRVVAENVRFLSPKEGTKSSSVNDIGHEVSFNEGDIPF